MLAGLAVVGVLFILQSWVAAVLVPNPGRLISEGDPAGTAFYDAARVAGGSWLGTLTAVATANRQLPGFLARLDPHRGVPVNATVLLAALSLAVGVYMSQRDDGITVLSTLVNFGALSAFLLLHLSVLRHFALRRTRGEDEPWLHVVSPLLGALVIGYVIIKANVAAQAIGLIWLGVGLALLAAFHLTGRRPALAGIGGGGACVARAGRSAPHAARLPPRRALLVARSSGDERQGVSHHHRR